MKARSIAILVALATLSIAPTVNAAPTVKQLQAKVHKLEAASRVNLGEVARLRRELAKQNDRVVAIQSVNTGLQGTLTDNRALTEMVTALKAQTAELQGKLNVATYYLNEATSKVSGLEARAIAAEGGLESALAVLPVSSLWPLIGQIYRRFPTTGIYSASVFVSGSYASYTFTRSP